MKPKRLIIHTENIEDMEMALHRVANVLPDYYKYKRQDDRRLTVRFEAQDVMIIYHDRSDAVVWS